jgi:hypothetical protein
MKTITIEQLANRIAARINASPRKDRDFTKSDFNIGEPLPHEIYMEFILEFHDYSQPEINEFTMFLTKLVDA